MTLPLSVIPRGMSAHVATVLAGEYDVPGLEGIRAVLDIGANCGAFALWAYRRWPTVTVTCYEPWPSNYRALGANCGALPGVTLHPLAVVGRDAPEIYLRPGLNNDGEVSEYDLGEQGVGTYHVATTVRAHALPPCDFLKVDTEGGEGEIIPDYLSAHHPSAIAYEWHRPSDRTDLHHLLVQSGYTQVAEAVRCPTRGVAKWLLSSLL